MSIRTFTENTGWMNGFGRQQFYIINGKDELLFIFEDGEMTAYDKDSSFEIQGDFSAFADMVESCVNQQDNIYGDDDMDDVEKQEADMRLDFEMAVFIDGLDDDVLLAMWNAAVADGAEPYVTRL